MLALFCLFFSSLFLTLISEGFFFDFGGILEAKMGPKIDFWTAFWDAFLAPSFWSFFFEFLFLHFGRLFVTCFFVRFFLDFGRVLEAKMGPKIDF